MRQCSKAAPSSTSADVAAAEKPAGRGWRTAGTGPHQASSRAALVLVLAQAVPLTALALLFACSSDPQEGDGAGDERDAATDHLLPDASADLDAGSGCATSDATRVEMAGLTVVHHDGQSFVRWADRAEAADGGAYRYRLYRSRAPIGSVADLDHAELIARGVLNHSGQLFGGAWRPDERTDPERPMSIIEEGEAPIATWSGLAVATATANDCGYYAVVATDTDDALVEGVEPGRNATTEPVAETVAPRVPMRVWTSDERPGPSVAQTRITGAEKLPLMLVLHASNARGGGAGEYGDYYSYFGDRTMGYRDGMPGVFSVEERRSPQMLYVRSRDAIPAPNGLGAIETYWFGYTAHPEGGARHAYPYTEARLSFLLPFAIERYRADPDRVYASGQSMGSTGSVLFAFRRPETFAAVYPNMPRFRRNSLVAVGTTPTTPEDTLPNGGAWEEHFDSVRFVRSHPGTLPFLGWNIGRKDHTSAWQDQVDMVRAMTEMRHGFAFAWNNGDHSTGVAPAAEIQRWYPAARFARNLSYPAFSESSIDDDPGEGDPANGDLVGGINLGFVWTDPAEDPSSWSVTISNEICEAPMTVSVTPRRAQHFLPAPGAAVRYVTSSGSQGSLVADAHGLVTVQGVVIAPGATTALQLTLD